MKKNARRVDVPSAPAPEPAPLPVVQAKRPAAKRGAFGPIYRAYIGRLKELGCVLCPTCNEYLAPEHWRTHFSINPNPQEVSA